ncbi:type III secretion system inner rod subunit SctI [Pseudomonas entomophila]|uniref:type III secretion system inner rod subunit SctI n=1 Tax=Pseudomonas entomophila TaxID=312306 RepID=UPI001F006D85|nr:type III secretion system inner rod subunit SctI [Pseudomonas entomophila]MCG8291431.1 type III secretion system inner rod subunit SctI [Pseudomonas entomophila]
MTIDVDVIEKAASQALEKTTPVQADTQDVQQFEQALAGGAGQPASPLHTVSDVASQISQSKQQLLAELSGPGELSPAKLMEAQYKLTQINLYQELIAKTVGRLTQNVETLMKTQ